MTLRAVTRRKEISMCAATRVLLALLLVSPAAWPQDAANPTANKASAATLKRDSIRCRAFDVDACYDAIRWNPGDPALLIALGDALLHAGRTADAIRNYRRAAALAPATRGLTAKINAAEAKLTSKRPTGPVVSAAAGKRFSNAAPVAQSH
jgi:cytochrome c-type biogenesis protein CcmH/NrfG